MKYLIGDIGNTSTKICILNRKFQIFVRPKRERVVESEFEKANRLLDTTRPDPVPQFPLAENNATAR